MPKRTIAHIHVWDKTNKGDLAIVLAVRQSLKNKFPDCRIVDFPIEVLNDYDAKKIALLNAADLIIIGGGGVLYRYFLPFSIKVIKALKKPVVIFGVGYIREVGARPLGLPEIKSIVALMAKAKAIGVRDYYTKSFLIKNGVDAKKIDLVGDPAVLLEEKEPTGLRLKKSLKIGLNLNYSGWLGFGLWREDILSAYRRTAEYFIKTYGAKIYYLKHHPGEDVIYKELRIPGMMVIDYEPGEQKHFYGQLDLVIGMMLHSVVMAFGAGTPEINVAYDLRNRNFAKFIGCPELVIDLKELKSGILLERAKQVVERAPQYRVKFIKKAGEIRKKQVDFLDKLDKYI
jgi:polysaccharide pyruvyl transferase WcaK-like protein